MERLTKRTVMGIVGNNDMVENYPLYKVANSDPLDHNITEQAFEKLAKYEDLEEQGLLLRLPCKVGDKAWYVHRGGIDEVIVDSFVFNVNLFANVSLYIGAERFGKTLTPYKTLFFSQVEAEQKLKEMESD